MNKTVYVLVFSVVASFEGVFAMDRRANGERPSLGISKRLTFDVSDAELKECDRLEREIKAKVEQAKKKNQNKNMREFRAETVAYTQEELNWLNRV